MDVLIQLVNSNIENINRESLYYSVMSYKKEIYFLIQGCQFSKYAPIKINRQRARIFQHYINFMVKRCKIISCPLNLNVSHNKVKLIQECEIANESGITIVGDSFDKILQANLSQCNNLTFKNIKLYGNIYKCKIDNIQIIGHGQICASKLSNCKLSNKVRVENSILNIQNIDDIQDSVKIRIDCEIFLNGQLLYTKQEQPLDFEGEEIFLEDPNGGSWNSYGQIKQAYKYKNIETIQNIQEMIEWMLNKKEIVSNIHFLDLYYSKVDQNRVSFINSILSPILKTELTPEAEVSISLSRNQTNMLDIQIMYNTFNSTNNKLCNDKIVINGKKYIANYFFDNCKLNDINNLNIKIIKNSDVVNCKNITVKSIQRCDVSNSIITIVHDIYQTSVSNSTIQMDEYARLQDNEFEYVNFITKDNSQNVFDQSILRGCNMMGNSPLQFYGGRVISSNIQKALWIYGHDDSTVFQNSYMQLSIMDQYGDQIGNITLSKSDGIKTMRALVSSAIDY